MEEVGHEVVHNPQLWVRGVRIAVRDQQTSFEAMIRLAFLAQQVTIFEQPAFGLSRDTLPVAITAKLECAV